MRSRAAAISRRSTALLSIAAALLVGGLGAPAAMAQARPDLNGVWSFESIYSRQGTPMTLRNTTWAPLSAGRPEDRKAKTFAENQADVTAELEAVQAGRPKPPGPPPFRPPYTAEGRAAATALAGAAPPAFGQPRDWKSCLPRNVMGLQSPVQIATLPDRILLVGDNYSRTVFLSGDHSDTFPTYEGTSVGHWEGKTLVIETTNWKGPTLNNWPISDKVKVTERLTLSANGKLLTSKVTYEDPAYMTEPLAQMTYSDLRGDVRLMRADCLEALVDAAYVDALNPVAGDVPAPPK